MKLLTLILTLTLWASAATHAQTGGDLQVSGYFQVSPVRISADLPEPLGSESWMEYRLQNRLNIRWDATQSTTLHWQMRTRLYSGDLVRDFPAYADAVDSDDGLANLSWMVANQESWFLHYIPDRLYADWNRGDLNIRAGRQRVNWGINMVTNPNDIFNIYSPYDFDYPERPGSDAIRVRYFSGFASRFEVAVSPARELRNSVAAMLYAFHRGQTDFQLIGGYYRELLTTGGGWAADIRGMGFKGETMLYIDPSNGENGTLHNFITTSAFDYMFDNSLFLVAEILYNHRGGREQFILLEEQISPDNPSFSKYQATMQLSYPIHPLLDGSMAAIWYPDEESLFMSPSLSYSVAEDFDLRVLGQFFIGSSDSVFSSAGNVLTASLTWNF